MEVKMLLLLAALVPGGGRAAGSHHGASMPGSPYNISRNDAGLQRAVLSAAYSFNNQSNDAFLFKPSAIYSAQRQVVRGFRYVVNFQICRTVCPKRTPSPDLSHCSFQPPGRLRQVFRCHMDLWLTPWERRRETLELLCRPVRTTTRTRT